MSTLGPLQLRVLDVLAGMQPPWEDASTIELDLVADPTTPIEPPAEVRPGVFVDTVRELLAQKLCALLSRTEARSSWWRERGRHELDSETEREQLFAADP